MDIRQLRTICENRIIEYQIQIYFKKEYTERVMDKNDGLLFGVENFVVTITSTVYGTKRISQVKANAFVQKPNFNVKYNTYM